MPFRSDKQVVVIGAVGVMSLHSKLSPVSDLDETACQSTEDQAQAIAESSSRSTLEVSGYSLVEMLGQGSFGEVWLAKNQRTEQMVAVKVMKTREHMDWDFFRREMDSLREVTEHPYVLTVLDADLAHDPPYIVTPYLTEGSLDQQKPDKDLALMWIEQIAEGLEYTHDKGLIHCDLKPKNVLLDDQGRVRIADYGQSVRNEATHGSCGTMGYMSPEQANLGPNSPEPLWDVYSFGATAYFLLTHRRPRLSKLDARLLREAGNTGRRFELYRELLTERGLKPIRELNSEVDEELAALVEACLSLDPEKRPPDLKAVRTDLQRRRLGLPLNCRKPWKPGYLLRNRAKTAGFRVAIVALVALVAVVGVGPSSTPDANPTTPAQSRYIGPFQDIGSSAVRDDIAALMKAGIVDSEDENFRPNDSITRRDFCRWVVRAHNYVYPSQAIRLAQGNHSQFKDVPPDDPDFPYIQGLCDTGYLPDTGTMYRPDEPLNRESMIYTKTLLDGASAQMNGNCRKPYMDIESVTEELRTVLHNHDNSGFGSGNFLRVYGNSGMFHPKREVTRAEAVTLCSGFGIRYLTTVKDTLKKNSQ